MGKPVSKVVNMDGSVIGFRFLLPCGCTVHEIEGTFVLYRKPSCVNHTEFQQEKCTNKVVYRPNKLYRRYIGS